MAIGLRQGDVVSVFAIVQHVGGDRAHLRIEGASADAAEIDVDSTQAIIVRRSVHQNDDVVYNGERGWKVLLVPEPGVFVLKPAESKPGDASSYRVASISEVKHASDHHHDTKGAPDPVLVPQVAETVAAPAVAAEPAVVEPVQPAAVAAEDASGEGEAQTADATGAAPAADADATRFPIEDEDAERGIHSIARRALDSRANPRERLRGDMIGGVSQPRRPDALEQAAGSIMDAGSVEVLDNPIGEPTGELVLKPTDRI